MVLSKLGDSLKDTFNRITNSAFVDDRLINELVKDIQRALLQSDINVKLVFELTKKIKERVQKEDAPAAVTKKEHLIKIVYEELVSLLGEKAYDVKLEKKPGRVMLLGLFGSGKTTTSGKLAKYFQKRGLSVALLQLDVYRPAAYDQLRQIGSGIGVRVFGDKSEKDPVKIYDRFKDELDKHDVVIVDTAGRDALSDDLIEELRQLSEKIQPEESLLVISGDIGQAAQEQAEAFHKASSITGVIVTKLDGTGKGGGALTACAATGAKVKLIGVGEKPQDLESFVPERFVGRLLGMGDLDALLEKAQDAISEDEAQDLNKKLLKGEFNLIDLYEQMSAMRKMGPLAKLVEMMPGFGQLKLPKEVLEVQEGKLDEWKIAMGSMTKEELERPEIMNPSRIDRVNKGSGISSTSIKELLKQHKQSKKLIKMFKGANPKNMEKMMKRMGGAKGLKV